MQRTMHKKIVTSVFMQTPLSELETRFTFEWKKAADMPFNMTEYPQAAEINGKVYIGGRIASLSSSYEAMRVVLVYDSQHDKWSQLPPYECMYFAMAAVNNQLVLIGGRLPEIGVTAQLSVWDGKWTKPFAPMPTARCSASAVSYIKWLIVIGGRLTVVSAKLSQVEILDTTLNQWYQCAPFPQPCSSISLTATVGNMCYALGGFTNGHKGSKKVFCVCLDDLVYQAVSQSARSNASAPPTPSPWLTLPNTPFGYSTAISLNGALFAIGGLDNTTTASIYLYQPSSKSWVFVQEGLPRGRERCACVALSNRRMLVAGGGYSSQEVDIAEVKYLDILL